MKIATAFVEIRTDKAKARADAEAAARGAAQGATAAFAQYFSAAVVVNEIGKAVKAASELEQAVGGTEAQFGKFSATVDAAAAKSAQTMGLSESAFRSLTTQIGGLLQGLGFAQDEAAQKSIELTQLGADLAATYGGSTREAVEALGAALRGEFDPLERYGASLRVSAINAKAVEMGLAESKNAVDDNARAQAALAIITERTAAAQGQFGRESETAAGKAARLQAQLEDQRAEIGAALLPILVQLADTVSTAMDAFGALPGPVQTAIVAMIGIAAVAGPVRNVIGMMGSLRDALTKISPAARGASTAMGVLAAATVLLSFEPTRNALTLFAGKVGETEQEVEELVAQLITAQNPLDDFASALANTLATNASVLSSAMQGAKLGVSDLTAAFEPFAGTVGASGAEWDALIAKLMAGLPATMQNAETQRELTQQLGFQLYAYQQLSHAIEARAALTAEEVVAADAGTAATDRGAQAQRDYVDMLLERNEAGRDANRIREREREAEEELARAHQEWADSINTAFSEGRGAVSQFSDEAMEDLDKWQEELAADIWAIADWQNNLTTIGTATSAEFAAYLAEMGLAGAGLVDEMANNADELEESYGLWLEATRQTTRDMVTEIGATAEDARRAARAVGAAIAEGVKAGIDSKVEIAAQAAANLVNEVLQTAREAGDIQSPSRVFRDLVGLEIVRGIAQGIIDGTPEAAIDAALAVGAITEEAADTLRETVAAEREATAMAERVAQAMIDEFERQREGVRDAARQLLDEAEDELAGLWSGIEAPWKRADLESRVTSARQRLAQAMSGGTDLEIADAQRASQRANFDLFRYLVQLGQGETSQAYLYGQRAGLSIEQIQSAIDAQERVQVAGQNLAQAGNVIKLPENLTIWIEGQPYAAHFTAESAALVAAASAGG